MLDREIAERHGGWQRVPGLITCAEFGVSRRIPERIQTRNRSAALVQYLGRCVGEESSRRQRARVDVNPIEGWFAQSAQRRVHVDWNVRLGEAPGKLAAMKVGIASNARKLVETLYCLLQSIRLDRQLSSEATDVAITRNPVRNGRPRWKAAERI